MEHSTFIGPAPAHVLEEEAASDVLLFDRDRDRFVSLNATAADVWRLADGEHTLGQIVDLLASSYDVGPDSIRDDVEGIVSDLVDKKLLQIRPGP